MKGSLLSINGLVVMNADDQRTININGNILIILLNRPQIVVILQDYEPILDYFIFEIIKQIT